jgi:hypothetical protein
MFYNRGKQVLELEGMYRNHELFLIAGQFPLDRSDLCQLEQRGLCVAAYNTGVRSIRPHLWICDDPPAADDLERWLDTRIVKFVPRGLLEAVIPNHSTDHADPLFVQDCPGVIAFEVSDALAEQLALSSNSEPTPESNLSILALLKDLGFQTVVWLSNRDSLENAEPVRASRIHLDSNRVEEVCLQAAIENCAQQFHSVNTAGMYDRAQRERDMEKNKAAAAVAKPDQLPPAPAPVNLADMHLEIVSHCWRYSSLLNFQLSSFVLAPPRVRVTMTVYYAEEDEKTSRLLKFISSRLPPNVLGNWRALPKEYLFRRAIGRNDAALKSTADWVWFTDCDYVFRQGFLDKLCAELRSRSAAFAFPRSALRVPEHLTEQLLKAVHDAPPDIIEIPPNYGELQTFSRAIGGLQIVRGDIAREKGYLKDNRKMQRPATHWLRAIDDVRFRKSLGIAGLPIELPGLVRLGHAVKGRSTAEVAN